MEDLQALRGQIDDIDRQLVDLFRRRMDVTYRVGEYKRAQGIPVLDEARERAVLELRGRHDPCVVHRAVPVIEAAAALAACELLGI